MKLEVTHRAASGDQEARLAHVHQMTRELAGALELVGFGLLALAAVLLFQGGDGAHGN